MLRASTFAFLTASSKRSFVTDYRASKIKYYIHKHEYLLPVDKSAYKDVDVELDDIELCLPEKNITVNLTWLRDSCHCKRCTHPSSKQRLIGPKDFRREMFSVKEVQLSEEIHQNEPHSLPTYRHQSGREPLLTVNWADNHQSKYSVNWLRYVDGLYKKPYLQLSGLSNEHMFNLPEDGFYSVSSSNNVNLSLWNVEQIKSEMKPIDYNNLVDGHTIDKIHEKESNNSVDLMRLSSRRHDALCSLTKQLVTYGLAKIINVPQDRDQVLQVVRSIAYERPTGYGVVFDVTVEPSEDINLAYSSLDFDLHTDLPYRESSPGVQLLHCIRNSTEGGLSFFADSFNAAMILRQFNPTLFEVLLKFPLSFFVRDPYRKLHFRSQIPTINMNPQGELSEVYYSPFTLPPIGFRDDIKLFYLAMDKYTKIIHSAENKLVDKMEPGDLYIFHNRRVLHGRSSYDPKTRRFLQGCYMDLDEISSLHEKLHSQMGTLK